MCQFLLHSTLCFHVCSNSQLIKYYIVALFSISILPLHMLQLQNCVFYAVRVRLRFSILDDWWLTTFSHFNISNFKFIKLNELWCINLGNLGIICFILRFYHAIQTTYNAEHKLSCILRKIISVEIWKHFGSV